MRRIKELAKLIPNSAIVADIGCDHAYLIVELFKLNNLNFAYAIDNKDGPIKNAINNINKFNLNHKCKVIKADGLDFYFDRKIDTLVFAGLGGVNVINIIKKNIVKFKKNIKYIICDIHRDNKKFNLFLNFLNFELDKNFIIEQKNKKYYLCRYVKNENI